MFVCVHVSAASESEAAEACVYEYTGVVAVCRRSHAIGSEHVLPVLAVAQQRLSVSVDALLGPDYYTHQQHE